MNTFYYVFVNMFRAIVIIVTIIGLFKRQYKRIAPAAIAITLTFLPWALGLLGVDIGALTGVLYTAVVCMAVFMGSGLRWYDRYAWWDRLVHCLSGIAFFGFGAALAGKAPDAGFAGTLAFGFTLSLSLHVLWEILEYLCDCALRSDHQRWQKVHPTVNHMPRGIRQPAGLADTMNDSIACLIGAVIALIGWWIVNYANRG